MPMMKFSAGVPIINPGNLPVPIPSPLPNIPGIPNIPGNVPTPTPSPVSPLQSFVGNKNYTAFPAGEKSTSLSVEKNAEACSLSCFNNPLCGAYAFINHEQGETDNNCINFMYTNV